MQKTNAYLDLPATRFLPQLCARAEELGAEVARIHDGHAIVIATLGTIEAHTEQDGLRLLVCANDAGSLASLTGHLDGLVAAATGKTPVWAGRAGPRLTMARVDNIDRISPSFRRLRLAGDFLAFRDGGAHFRLLIGPKGAAWPSETANGLNWPGGIDAWHRPPYTIRRMDPHARWIDVDIFLHDGGRVTEWTKIVRPGDEIALTGPGGRNVKQAAWMGLVGDETALPVIVRALEAAHPDTRGQAFLMIADPADAQPVDLPEGMQLTWVLREKHKTLAGLLHRLSHPDGEGRHIFFAGERQQAAKARVILHDMGLAAGEFHTATYWTAG
ncbi:MAG: siderophore-interacting protein [Rhodobacteraceae bacterium]|nr:siderophore-interacting protein [Paracoccaceae bacterium]